MGKSSLVNRIVNNSFYTEYSPTTNLQKYRLTYRLKSSSQEGEDEYYQIEIIDTFPHDHPFLSVKTKEEQDQTKITKEKKLQNELKQIIENNFEKQKFHAYIFVYDASDRESFTKLVKMIQTVGLIEKSEKRGKKQMTFNTRKIVIGNKADLKLEKHVLTKEDKAEI